MENKSSPLFPTNKGCRSASISPKNNYLAIKYKAYLSNDDYIKLFYNSKNGGLNKNFPLNVIYNKKKSKSTK